MQVARNFLLTSEKTFLRKLREIFLAIRIEGALTKEEILTLYLNKIFLGQRAFGVGAAAEVYYGKTLAQLRARRDRDAGRPARRPRRPTIRSTSPERALHRRAYVLRRMLELGFIDERGLHDCERAPIVASVHGPKVEEEASYVAEMVRADMLRRFGEEAYTAGYRVKTTLDSALQRDAVHGHAPARCASTTAATAIADRSIAGRTGRGRTAAWDALLDEYPRVAELELALVLAAGGPEAEVYCTSADARRSALEDAKWARRYVDENHAGARPTAMSEVRAAGRRHLRQRRARSAGSSRRRRLHRERSCRWIRRTAPCSRSSAATTSQLSKFNRAVQARRQPGSSFKPFVYSAALEHGFTPATLVPDSPVVFDDAGLEQAWRPENYTREFGGLLRLREALVKSRNLVSIRVLKTVGVTDTIEHLQHFGFKADELPHNLSLALGTATLSPLQMVSGVQRCSRTAATSRRATISSASKTPNGEVVFEADPLVVCASCIPPTDRDRVDARCWPRPRYAGCRRRRPSASRRRAASRAAAYRTPRPVHGLAAERRI